MQVRFGNQEAATNCHQALVNNKMDVNFIRMVKKDSKGPRVRPSSIFVDPKAKSNQSDFGDASIELTFNLLKIRPEEEVRGRSQSNSAFFEELSSNSKVQ